MQLKILNKSKQVLYEQEQESDNHDAVKRDNNQMRLRNSSSPLQTSITSKTAGGVTFSDHEFDVFEEVQLQAINKNILPGLLFMQKGEMTADLLKPDYQHRFDKPAYSFLSNPYSSYTTIIPRQRSLRFQVVTFEPDVFVSMLTGSDPYLSKFADKILNGCDDQLQKQLQLNIQPRMKALIIAMNKSGSHSPGSGLFLQSMALELLGLHISEIAELKTPITGIKLSGGDLIKIRQAHEIITTQFHEPPDLSTLARLTGLNEFKLKTGFKQVYKKPVFSYLNDYRLEWGRTQLSRSDLSVSEIGYQCGFGSPAHFSHAFKKKYGVSPLQLRK